MIFARYQLGGSQGALWRKRIGIDGEHVQGFGARNYRAGSMNAI
jgi:hypothetical protein